MRYLKNKVARALQSMESLVEPQVKLEPSDQTSVSSKAKQNHIEVKQEVNVKVESTSASYSAVPHSSEKKSTSSNKNIVKNFARAMVNFTLSDIALYYLEPITENEGVNLKKFIAFIQNQKQNINSIRTLRELLLITKNDSDEISQYKRVFRDVCEVFVKYFSVNWIYSSKLADRMTHLKYRFKILRRIRNPEHFTYLENFNKRY